jgi:hypothetical protein
MEYQGVTTYEPTLLHVLAVLVLVTVVTYPLSLILVALGIIEPAPKGSTLAGRALHRANDILRAQLLPLAVAWFAGIALCTFLFFAWLVLGGLLVMVGVMRPVENVLSWQLLTLMGCVHIAAQAVAYVVAIREAASSG